MKILNVTSSMDIGGVETHILSLSRALSSMGHDICVVSSGGRLAQSLTDTGISHIKLPLDRKDALSILYSKRRLSELIRNGGFDVIHAHSRLPAYLCSSLAEKYGIPLVTTVHAKFSLSFIYHRLSRWGCLAVAVSEDLRQYLCQSYGFPAANTRLIENGIDTDAFKPLTFPKAPPTVVFVSRLDRDCSDGAFALFRLYSALKKRYPTLRILICGGGSEYKRLSALREQMRADDIRLLGRVEDIAPVLQSASVFVGVSRAALEAMSCGIPTVLGGNEGFLGLLGDRAAAERGASANFCCRGEKRLTDKALYRELCTALELSTKERERLSALLSGYVREHHSIEVTAKKTEAVYREAMARGSCDRGRIVLLGYYGFGNLGDDALLRAAIRRAREVFVDKPISALTRSHKRDSRIFGIRCINRYSPLAVMRELWGAEVLVLGGGTLLQDRTSLRSLLYYSALLYFASMRGLRIELWGNGLERPQSPLAAALIRTALSCAHYIGLRDVSSVVEALRLVKASDGDKLYFEKDLASEQSPSDESRIDLLLESLGLRADGKIKAFAVVAVKGSAGRGYLQILGEKLRELKENGISLVFVPMYPKEDRAECLRLCRSFGGVVAESLSEGDVVGLMKKSLVVCGMRLHSLVFAGAADAPFVGFGGEAKIESFCRENGGVYFTELY